MKNLGYFFKEGARSMFSHGFMSFAAIGVTVACLLIMGTFSLVAYNANENLADLQKENAMVAFVDDSLTESKAKALQSDLEKVDNVADCTFVSRQEARDAYVAEYDEDDMYKNLQPEVFRHRYVIHLTDPDKIAASRRTRSLAPSSSTGLVVSATENRRSISASSPRLTNCGCGLICSGAAARLFNRDSTCDSTAALGLPLHRRRRAFCASVICTTGLRSDRRWMVSCSCSAERIAGNCSVPA